MPTQMVVVGAGIGGLSAAIHARLHGHDVLVLEQRASAGGKAAPIEQSGYRLDPGPSIVILTEIYEEIFELAGRNMADYLQFERLDPFTRVYHPEFSDPIDLPSDPEKCFALMDQIAPRDRNNLEQLIERLDPVIDGMTKTIFDHPVHSPLQMVSLGMARFASAAKAMKPYKDVVDCMFESSLLRAFFYGFPSYSGQSYRSPSPGSLLIPYFMMRRGVYWPVGGIGAIPAALFRLASELGVEFRFASEVTGLEIEGKTAKGVQLGSEVIVADKVISNRDRLSSATWKGQESTQRPSFSYFTVHLGIKRKMPELSHHTLVIPPDFGQGFEELYQERKFPTQPIVYLNETAQTDPSTAPEGCSNLFAVITCPAMEPHIDWHREQAEYQIRIWTTLRPYNIHFEPEEIEFTRVQTPVTFQERDGNFMGSLYGPDEKHRLWGMMPLRCVDEEIKNLFYCGGSVQPGAGMPMVALSGKFAADLANR